MLTKDFTQKGWSVVKVGGKSANEQLSKLRIPPAWTDVAVDNDPKAVVLATGLDAAGRMQRLYSSEHVAQAKDEKFGRVRALLGEWEDIRTQIEGDINYDNETRGYLITDAKKHEAALVAYLIYETGMRPGSNRDTLAQCKAYGATTLNMRHVHPSSRGVRLKFIGKKGVPQNILVTNPYLTEVIIARRRNAAYLGQTVFNISSGELNAYFKTLGSGQYTPKDFRTARGTSLAMALLGNRVRIPTTKAKRKKMINDALDKVAKMLGNTRAVSRNSYVDPLILERFTT